MTATPYGFRSPFVETVVDTGLAAVAPVATSVDGVGRLPSLRGGVLVMPG
jgi:hypothetical protein